MPSRVGGPTIASVAQVGPDDVFLGEAEDTEPSSSHGGVDHNARVCHHACPFKQLYPKTTGTRRCSRLEANHSYGWILASGIRRANKWFSGKWSVRIVNPAASEKNANTPEDNCCDVWRQKFPKDKHELWNAPRQNPNPSLKYKPVRNQTFLGINNRSDWELRGYPEECMK